MSETRGIDRWAPAVSLLALSALLAVLGAGAWAHRGDPVVERRDLDRERMCRAVAARIRAEHEKSGQLPRSLDVASTCEPAWPVSYRVLDANRFQLGVEMERPRGPHGALGFLDGAAHPRGLVWYTFDVRKRPMWTDGGPITLDPEDEAGS